MTKKKEYIDDKKREFINDKKMYYTRACGILCGSFGKIKKKWFAKLAQRAVNQYTGTGFKNILITDICFRMAFCWWQLNFFGEVP